MRPPAITQREYDALTEHQTIYARRRVTRNGVLTPGNSYRLVAKSRVGEVKYVEVIDDDRKRRRFKMTCFTQYPFDLVL